MSVRAFLLKFLTEYVYCIAYTFYCNTMDSSNSMWRPPYPSENLKTPRFVHVQTYSTTNPYATQEEQQQAQPCQQAQQHQQAQPCQQAQHSKRENSSDKIYERGLTPQVGMNPFLQGNYVQDLETQNQFLKPLNSNLNLPN
jgi:hypothetical protein